MRKAALRRIHAFPGIATVSAFVNTRSGAMFIKIPGGANLMPHGGIYIVGVLRINDNINSACLVINVQSLLPALAAVGGHINAAFLVERIKMSHHRYPGYIGIGRM